MLCSVISSTPKVPGCHYPGSQLRSSACLPLPNSIFHPAQQILSLLPFLAKPVINQDAIKLPKVYWEQVMGKGVISSWWQTPASPVGLGWVCRTQGQCTAPLHHATQKGELLSSRKQTEKNKSLIPHPQLLSIKQKVNTRVCSIFQIQLSSKNIVLQDQLPCIRDFESHCNFWV